jgi:hypothetical protein
MVHLIGEQHAMTSEGSSLASATKITDYQPDDQIQLLIGTVQVLSRISINKNADEGLWQKPPATVIVSHTILKIHHRSIFFHYTDG